MKKRTLLIIGLVFLLGFAVMGNAKDNRIVVKISDTETADSNIFKALKYMGDLVAKNSNYQIIFEYYPSGVLSSGNVGTMVEQCQMGTIEALSLSTIQVTSWLPELSVVTLPFLFDNIEQSYQVCQSAAAQEVLALYDRIGMVGVAAWPRNLRQFIHGKKPLLTPADFVNQKMRVPEIKLFVDFFKSLGAVVTPMTWGEVYTALQLGSIDGLEQPTETVYPEKLYEVQKYLTISDYAGDWKIISFSKRFWDKLTPEQQRIIIEAAEKAREYKYRLDKESTEKDLKLLEEKGMVVVQLTPEQKELFKPYAEKVWKDFEPVIGKDLLHKMLEAAGKL